MGLNLKKYLVEENISPSAWAKKVGIPQPVISRFLAGKRGLSLDTAFRIQEATGGKVRIEDLRNGQDLETHHG